MLNPESDFPPEDVSEDAAVGAGFVPAVLERVAPSGRGACAVVCLGLAGTTNASASTVILVAPSDAPAASPDPVRQPA